jgi:hypothetical protein
MVALIAQPQLQRFIQQHNAGFVVFGLKGWRLDDRKRYVACFAELIKVCRADTAMQCLAVFAWPLPASLHGCRQCFGANVI